jgi:hypothetical protein
MYVRCVSDFILKPKSIFRVFGLKTKKFDLFCSRFSVTKDEPLRLSCVTPLGLENAV